MNVIGSGLASIGLIGAGVGIGVLFAGFLVSFAINPVLERKLFTYSLFGFALTESIALFAIMITFLLLFGA